MSKMIENYILKESCGSGQYGKVYKGIDTKKNACVAVKVMKVDKFREVPKLNEFTNNEIKTLSKIENKNVIRFIEILQTQNNVYLIYEFCNGGTLEELIQKKRFLSETQSLHIFSQILNAFSSLVKENILHRDLKPSNILLNDGVIKVADFGFCKSLLGPQDLTKTMVGSPIYMAPEILKGQNYSIKADIWSMGVVLFEMLFGYCPYEDKTIAALITQINHKLLKIPKHIQKISQLTEMLLKYMLVVDPKQRIEWSQLLQIQGAIQNFLNGNQPIDKQIQNKTDSQKENKSAIQPVLQQQPIPAQKVPLIQPKQEQNKILQPIQNQTQQQPALPLDLKPTDSHKQLIKQHSQNNLNYKTGCRVQQQNQMVEPTRLEKQHSLQPDSTNFHQHSVSNSSVKETTQQNEQSFDWILKNLRILFTQRSKILKLFTILQELMVNSQAVNEGMIVVIFTEFRLIFKQLTDFRQLLISPSKHLFENQDQFFETREFKQFKEIIQKEEEEIIKCLEMYFEEMQQCIHEVRKRKDTMHQLIEFDFISKKFQNPVAVGTVVNELIMMLENTKLTETDVISREFKALILAVNSLIDYLLNENENQQDPKIKYDFDPEFFANIPENQWNNALIQKIMVHKQEFNAPEIY